ncbi:hypothetical protein IM543_11110 [Massilia sp. UMI-21]|nr:hypothetical protein IM543_11110 [Massilia sp. UMI-21]
MKQFKAFASTFRIPSLLCCGAAVLLTACGGNIDGGGDQLSATAAGVSTDAGAVAAARPVAAAAAVEAIAETAPVASIDAGAAAGTEPAPAINAAGAPGQATDSTTTAEFELSGYGSEQQPAQTGQQGGPITQ